MKIKSTKFIFIISAVLFNLSVLIYMTLKPLLIQSSAEKENRIIRLKCSLYDPYDPMKGRYVRLTFDETKKDISSVKIDDKLSKILESPSWKKSLPFVYGIYENNDEGISILTEISISKPDAEKLFIKTPALYYETSSKIFFDIQFDKYYMQEEAADKIDKMSRSEFESMNPVLELWADNKGEVIQKNLLLNF